MLNSNPTVTQAPMLPIPAAGAGTPANPAGTPPFAQALDQAAARQRSAAREAENADGEPSAVKDAAAAPTSEPARTDAAVAVAAGAARRLAALKAAGRHAGAENPASAPAKESVAATEPAATTAADKDMPAHATQASGDPAAWMSALALPHVQTGDHTADAAQAEDRPARPDLDTELRGRAQAARATPAWDAVADLAQGRARAAALAQAEHGGAGIDNRFAAEAALHATGFARQATVSQGGLDIGSTALASPAATTAGVATMAPASAPGAASTAFQAELHAALGSSEFAPALGTMLSVLVRDGIEHAQLKLNPAEMGPVEVRIRLDGSQAQVDFSAAQADTRQALQDAVPALAGALRESGLTLTGGGVFEQPREQRGEAQTRGEHSRLAPDEELRGGNAGPAAVPGMARARGVVDLYA